MNHILNAVPGERFKRMAKRAKKVAVLEKVTVEFEFNGVTCLVTKGTNIEFLLRDYKNARLMEWKTIGPICSSCYSASIQHEINRKKAEKQ